MSSAVFAIVLILGAGVLPVQAESLTSVQIQSILSLLSAFGVDSATIANVNTALTGGISTTIGGQNSNDERFSFCSTNFKNSPTAVKQFQAKYGISQTGTVGPITRAKLDALYRCGINISTTTIAMIDPTPSTKISLAPVLASDLTETINVLVNQEYASKHPEMQENIVQMIADVNAMLGKDPQNQKRYVLGKVMTYPDATTLYTIATNPAYFSENNFVGNPKYGGTTIVYWTQDAQMTVGNQPQFFLDKVGGATDFETVTSFGGKVYDLVFIPDVSTETSLLGKSKLTNYVNGLSSYDAKLAGLEHELGHTHGTGAPEWYGLVCSDNSGTLPNLSYNLKALYPNDPMSGAEVLLYNIKGYQFAPFNSWLIDHNANHQLNLDQVMAAAQKMTIQVKVVDASGSPVPDATVTVYGGVSSDGGNSRIGVARDMQTTLQTIVTDANGTAIITNSPAWYGIGVKASGNGKYAGAVITTIDLEVAYFQQGLSTYTLTLTLN